MNLHFCLILTNKRKLFFFAADNQELTEYLTKQSETLHKYVINLDSVLEALNVHDNSVTVLTVLGVKATAQKPPDIPGVQYHTAIAMQINDFVVTINEDELRVLAEPCKLISTFIFVVGIYYLISFLILFYSG